MDELIVEADPDAPGQEVFSTITLVNSHDELMESLGLDVKAQGRYGFFLADAKAKYAGNSPVQLDVDVPRRQSHRREPLQAWARVPPHRDGQAAGRPRSAGDLQGSVRRQFRARDPDRRRVLLGHPDHLDLHDCAERPCRGAAGGVSGPGSGQVVPGQVHEGEPERVHPLGVQRDHVPARRQRGQEFPTVTLEEVMHG